jgi:hypothetical protein
VLIELVIKARACNKRLLELYKKVARACNKRVVIKRLLELVVKRLLEFVIKARAC